MTTTILRYEFIRTKRPLLVILGIAIVLIALADLLGIFVGPLGLLLATTVALILLPAVQLYFVIDFYRSSYGTGAVLTHSLPIAGRRLFWTKILYAFGITLIVSVISLLLLLAQAQLGLAMSDSNLVQAYRQVQTLFYDVSGMWPVIFGFAIWLLVAPLASMFSSVVIGSGGWARRLSIGGPIIVYMSYYVIMQIVAMVSFFIPPVYDIANGQIHAVSFWQSVMADDPTAMVPLSIIIFHLLALATLLAWASRNMHNKVELR